MERELGCVRLGKGTVLLELWGWWLSIRDSQVLEERASRPGLGLETSWTASMLSRLRMSLDVKS